MFAVVLLLGTACQRLATEPGQRQLRVETSSATFVRVEAASSVGVPFVVHNQGSRPVYLARCGERLSAALDRREAGRWVQHSGDPCPANLDMTPVELARGAKQQSERRVLEPGVYRLRLRSSDTRSEPSQWDAVSNVFTIE